MTTQSFSAATNSLAPLETTIAQLRALVQQDVISGWQTGAIDRENPTVPASGNLAQRNEKGHIAWEKGRQELWLAQRFILPETIVPAEDPNPFAPYGLTGLTARLALTWWADLAEVYVDGQLVQVGDLFDHSARIVLSESVVPGQVVDVVLRLVSPGHDGGALMRSCLLFESDYDAIDPGFVADELAVIRSYVTTIAPEEAARVAEIVESVLPETVSAEASLIDRLFNLRTQLQYIGDRIKQHTIYLLGHAHLDLAWLWNLDDTWDAAVRTFASALQLQEEFPELIFAHTTPVLYEWIERNRPDLFEVIQQRIASGQWEALGGLWVEPEMNLIGGESIVRQVLYGQRYYQEKFGSLSRIAWLPDTFGFAWQIPQILRQGGIEFFVTQKLRWNDTTQYPSEVFQWQAPDGSQALAVMSAPIGEGIDPIKMADYCWTWTERTGYPHPLWLPGVGDHGGGPTRDMLTVARRWQRSPFFPQLQFTTAIDYLTQLAPAIDHASSELPVHNSEIYLEFHRGCYTTHADQKAYNRDCENALYQAELWASIATLATQAAYPKHDLESAWKTVLFNQFHDILPGTSIADVFTTINPTWEAALATLQTTIEQAQTHIIQRIHCPTPPHPQAQVLVVFNSLNWDYTGLVTATIPAESYTHWNLLDFESATVLQQHCLVNPVDCILSFYVGIAENHSTSIPANGYRCFWIVPSESIDADSDDLPDSIELADQQYVLENTYLRVIINPTTGNIDSLWDKQQQREVLRAPGNHLQFFQDSGQYWDAWNIDPAYASHPLEAAIVTEIATSHPVTVASEGAVCPIVERKIYVTRKFRNSTFRQIYRLHPQSSILEIENHIHWQEKHVLVKAAFPCTIEADFVTYETACGAIQRTTRPKTPAETAQWEVPALRWADLSNAESGISLLCDRKHGYDHTPNTLRLTLLRGSEWPDPEADMGYHTFTYALYPHTGDWRSAKTPHKALEHSLPLQALAVSPHLLQGTLPPSHRFFQIEADTLLPLALKQAEDDPNAWILRCYEAYGAGASIACPNALNLEMEAIVDGLERTQREQPPSSTVNPWQIVSWKLTQKPIDL